MQNKNEQIPGEITFLGIKSKSKFWMPVERNGWWIKFSTYRDTFILLMFVSEYTTQTIIRYFSNEDDAVNFINFVTEKDSKNYLDNQ
jgi:hypothetical protein